MSKFSWSNVKVSELYVSAVDVKPFDFDFSEGYGDTWEVLQPEGSEPGDERWQEPMMNTWYPLPDTPDNDAADILTDSPFAMCIVYNNDTREYGLAMTGGGMDMSWDIAGAYVVLGFLPPVHLRLPEFAGKRVSTRSAKVMSAMERSYRVMAGWMASNIRDLRNLRQRMAK